MSVSRRVAQKYNVKVYHSWVVSKEKYNYTTTDTQRSYIKRPCKVWLIVTLRFQAENPISYHTREYVPNNNKILQSLIVFWIFAKKKISA